MRQQFLIIPAILLFQVSAAQDAPAPAAPVAGTVTVPMSAASSTPVNPPNPPADSAPPAPSEPGRTRILDYESVFEASTVEQEVKMATERFSLTPDQADIWLTAATDRRAAEKKVRETLDSKAETYERSNVYRGLRTSLNTFHETITGYLTPAQKQALENDRMIIQEKQRRLAKLPPPPPPAPVDTVSVAPVDSTAIKQEAEKSKGKSKKAKKKKKAG